MTTERRSTAKGRPSLVFVIEDDDVQRRGLSRFLRREGFTVCEFSDAESALDDVSSAGQGPDLVVCDYKLPGRNGLDVIKEMGPDRRTRFILISAYLTEELSQAARTAGFSRTLEKPVSLDRLLKECKAAIDTGDRAVPVQDALDQNK